MFKKAFTLIEIIITMVLFSIMAVGITQLIGMHLGFQKSSDMSFRLQQEALVVFSHLASNMRDSESADIVSSAGVVTLRMKNRDGITRVEYDINGTSLIYRKYNDQSEPAVLLSSVELSSNIDSLIFRDKEFPGNSVDIRILESDLTLKDTVKGKEIACEFGSFVTASRLSKRFKPVALMYVEKDAGGNYTKEELSRTFTSIMAAVSAYESGAQYFTNPDSYEIRCMGNTLHLYGGLDGFNGLYEEAIVINRPLTIKGSYYDDEFSARSTETCLSVIDLASNLAADSGVRINADIHSGTIIVFDGFVVQNNTGTHGSGIYISADNSSGVTLSDNVIRFNMPKNWGNNGVGVYAYAQNNSYINITGNTVDENESYNAQGSGVYSYADTESSINIKDNIIRRNVGSQSQGWGGGIYSLASGVGASIDISHNMIEENFATNEGGGMRAEAQAGAGIAIYNNNIINNNASVNNGFGGGIHATAAGTGSEITINNNVITGNQTSHEGAGARVRSDGTSVIRIFNNMIIDNDASGGGSIGGGLYIRPCDTSSVFLANNLVARNRSKSYGGGVNVTTDATASVRIVNNTITGNLIEYNDGQGIYISQVCAILDVRNLIIWGNDGGWAAVDFALAGPTTAPFNAIQYNCIETPMVSGTGNIINDPSFVNPGSDDYHLSAGSPCINAGDPAASYYDPDNTRNDMGVYGGPGFADPIGTY